MRKYYSLAFFFMVAFFSSNANATESVVGKYTCNIKSFVMDITQLEFRESGNALISIQSFEEKYRRIGKFEIDKELVIIHLSDDSLVFEKVDSELHLEHMGIKGSCSSDSVMVEDASENSRLAESDTTGQSLADNEVLIGQWSFVDSNEMVYSLASDGVASIKFEDEEVWGVWSLTSDNVLAMAFESPDSKEPLEIEYLLSVTDNDTLVVTLEGESATLTRLPD